MARRLGNINLERTIAAVATAWLAGWHIGAASPALDRVLDVGDVGTALAGGLFGHALGLLASPVELAHETKAVPDGGDDSDEENELRQARHAEHRVI